MNILNRTFGPNSLTNEYKFILGITGNGLFSTNSTYQLINSQSGNPILMVPKCFNWIWKLKLPNKIKSFFWLLFHERLHTNSYLHSVSLNINPCCTFVPMSQSSTSSSFAQKLDHIGMISFNSTSLKLVIRPHLYGRLCWSIGYN